MLCRPPTPGCLSPGCTIQFPHQKKLHLGPPRFPPLDNNMKLVDRPFKKCLLQVIMLQVRQRLSRQLSQYIIFKRCIYAPPFFQVRYNVASTRLPTCQQTLLCKVPGCSHACLYTDGESHERQLGAQHLAQGHLDSAGARGCPLPYFTF